MSYFGAEFPAGIDPELYREIYGIGDITCPLFRRVVLRALSVENTARFTCDGCGTKEAIIIEVDLETERLFVRRDSRCGDGER